MRILWLFFFTCFHFLLHAQQGIITGTVLDEKGKALENATVQLVAFTYTTNAVTSITDKNGFFNITNISFGYYRLRLSYVSLQTITIDSLFFTGRPF
ncbi:MAG: carboxypeptidase-like regulatory domain-containing protein [Bacteroidota bacterium]|nr:carboxypeptidase-like regulatory domain-containing protein [Bacteroidota bacterium]